MQSLTALRGVVVLSWLQPLTNGIARSCFRRFHSSADKFIELVELMKLTLLAAGILFAASTLVAQPSCSPNLAGKASTGSVNRNEVILEVYINDAGPYPFLLDTGSQITMIDESLAEELKLKPTSSASVVGVSMQGKGAKYAFVDSVRVGHDARMGGLYTLIFDMKDMHAAGYEVRGLIGEDFLSHFDETIDNTHNRVCFNITEASN